jgi:hypothetical protein
MRRSTVLASLSGLVLACLFAAELRAQPKAVKLTNKWMGSVDDVALKKGVPEVITNEKAFEKVWKAWKVGAKLPKVDFTKEIVLVGTTSGSRLNLSARLDDKGDLQIIGFGTADFGPGFRYVLGTVPRAGVKTVNKKELPKE